MCYNNSWWLIILILNLGLGGCGGGWGFGGCGGCGDNCGGCGGNCGCGCN